MTKKETKVVKEAEQSIANALRQICELRKRVYEDGGLTLLTISEILRSIQNDIGVGFLKLRWLTRRDER